MDDRIPRQIPHEQQRGVPTGDDQHHAGIRQRPVLEGVGGHVPGEMVHAIKRDTQRVGRPLRRGDTDLQSTGKPGPGGDGDGVNVPHLQPRIVQRGPHHGGGSVDMRPSGDLRHDTPVPGVLVHARGHGVAQQFPVPDETRAGLVAGRLDTQHHR
nr:MULTISPECIES: hypothetical protein [Streptomyces]